MKYFLSIERNTLLVPKTTWINLKCILLSTKCQIQQTIYGMILFIRDFGKVKTMGTEIRSMVSEV
jgi:hypothetical protein